MDTVKPGKLKDCKMEEIPYKDRNTIKTNITGSQLKEDRWMTTKTWIYRQSRVKTPDTKTSK